MVSPAAKSLGQSALLTITIFYPDRRILYFIGLPASAPWAKNNEGSNSIPV